MSDVKIYDSKLNELRVEKTTVSLEAEDVSVATVHQVVKALLAAQRQGTASTKNRAKVRGGGAKPFKQKGTGNARRGSSRSPLMVGGGTAFGPTPRDYKQKINKKMMNKAIQSVLADKLAEGCLFVVDKFDSDGKTKTMNGLLSSKDLNSTLLISGSGESKEILATRNLKRAKGMSFGYFNVYDALKYKNLMIDEVSFNSLLKRLEK